MSSVRLWTEAWDRPFVLANRRIDPVARRIEFNGAVVDVEPRVMAVLIALARRQGETLTRQEFIDQIWEGTPGADQSLNNAVSLLRSALGDTDPSRRLVQTIHRRGYCLRAPVVWENTADLPDTQSSRHQMATAPERRLFRRPVALAASVALLLALGVYALGDWPRRADATADQVVQLTDRSTIAVLPFTNRTGNPGDDYLAVGLARGVLSALAPVDSLAVAPQADSFGFSGNESVAEIASHLRVAHVLEGDIYSDGDHLSVTARLFDAADGHHTWTASFDTGSLSILAIQREIATAIVDRLAGDIGVEERRRLATLPTDNISAYEAYLLGSYEWGQWSPAGFQRAIRHYERAVALDPDFRQAFVDLALAYLLAGTHYGWMAPEEAMPKVKAAVAHGLAASDPHVRADALGVYADVLTYEHDWAAARTVYEQAYALRPLPTLGHALLFSILGEHERAIALLQERREKGMDSKGERSNLAWAYFNARHYVRARSEAEAALALDSRFADGYRVLGRAQLLSGDMEAAVGSFERAVQLLDRAPTTVSDLAVALARAGRDEDARELLAELEQRREAAYVPAPLIAQVYANLGNSDAAFAWLRQAMNDQARGVIFLAVNPFFDPLRSDPRLAGMLSTLGLGS